jgi:hypothetical protein
LLFAAPFVLSSDNFAVSYILHHLGNLGTTGDYFAGLLTPLALLWFIITALLQRHELRLQRNEFALVREEYAESRKALERQADAAREAGLTEKQKLLMEVFARYYEGMRHDAASIVARLSHMPSNPYPASVQINSHAADVDRTQSGNFIFAAAEHAVHNFNKSYSKTDAHEKSLDEVVACIGRMRQRRDRLKIMAKSAELPDFVELTLGGTRIAAILDDGWDDRFTSGGA